jgi:predicted MFS family arabinose efflux permease
MLPIMAKDVLKVGASGQGVMMMCVGLGALFGSLALASFSGSKRKGMMFLGANLLFPPTLIIVALSRSFPLTLVTLLVLGFAMILQNSLTNTLLQTEVPDHLRGRVMGLYNLTFNGMTPFGSLQAGALANAFGAPAALLVGGVVCFGRSLLMARSNALRKLE